MAQQVKTTVDKLTSLLLANKIIKTDLVTLIHVLEGNEKLKNKLSQADESESAIKDFKNYTIEESGEVHSKLADSVIAKIYKTPAILETKGDSIIYICPCSFLDILSISTGTKSSTYEELKSELEGDFYYNNNYTFPFLGKDIKKSLERKNIEIQLLEDFISSYVDAEKPISDNIFYNVTMKRFGMEGLKIRCTRNLTLSPRPLKK